MEKKILNVYLVILTTIACSCNSISKQELISKTLWGDVIKRHNDYQDSILVISEYKKTDSYQYIWSKFRKCPFRIPAEKRTMIKIINTGTIFINKETASEDYLRLIRENKISISKPMQIDDSFDGYIFIFKNDNKLSFIKMKTEHFFDSLQNYSEKNKNLYLNGENNLFDSFATSIWNLK